MAYLFGFEKLDVWQESRKFAGIIYEMTEAFPPSEKYGLCSQMRRASVSIVSNIAEGSSRISPKDQANFYQIAFSSLTELLNQLIIATDIRYLDLDEYNKVRPQIEAISNKIHALRESALKRIK